MRFFFFQAEDGIRDYKVTGVQTCALPIYKIPGFRCQAPDGAFYAWVNIEDTGLSAEEVQRLLLEEAGVAGIAGAAFGPGGKNYLRFSLASARRLLEEALERIQRVSQHWRAAISR